MCAVVLLLLLLLLMFVCCVCVCVCGCTVLAAGVTECLCLRVQESFVRIGLRGAVQDTGGEERAPWRMIIYHILGIIVVPPFDRTLLASQPCGVVRL